MFRFIYNVLAFVRTLYIYPNLCQKIYLLKIWQNVTWELWRRNNYWQRFLLFSLRKNRCHCRKFIQEGMAINGVSVWNNILWAILGLKRRANIFRLRLGTTITSMADSWKSFSTLSKKFSSDNLIIYFSSRCSLSQKDLLILVWTK